MYGSFTSLQIFYFVDAVSCPKLYECAGQVLSFQAAFVTNLPGDFPFQYFFPLQGLFELLRVRSVWSVVLINAGSSFNCTFMC